MVISMVKVSICIPAYNNADELGRLLKSIYMQDFKDFEVNISDDSTNNDIEHLIKKYPQVNYKHNKKPLGHIFNWNEAVKMSSGEYIKIMFSDDWFSNNNSLGEFVHMLDSNRECSMAFCGSRQVMLDDDKQSYTRCADDEFISRLRVDYMHLFLGNQIGAPSATIYRRGNELALFDEKSNWASDMYLYFDLLKKNPKFAYTREPLVSIGVHNNQYTESFTEKDARIYDDYKYMYQKYNLQESTACKEYFTEKFIIKYNKGLEEAKEMGIETSIYHKKYLIEIKNTVKCFVASRIRKK